MAAPRAAATGMPISRSREDMWSGRVGRPARKPGKSQRVFSAVKTARQAGASWHEIGTAAQVTRQTAHRRYAALIPGDGRG